MLACKYIVLQAEQVAADKLFQSQNGGYSPQFMINEMSQRVAAGEINSCLLTGCEVLATFMRAMKQGYTLPGTTGVVETFDATGRKTTVDASKAKVLQWGDDYEASPPVSLGFELPGMLVTRQEARHGLVSAPNQYALIEQAIRKHEGRTVPEHLASLGQLFEGFSKRASEQPEHAWFPTYRDAAEISTVTEVNRIVGYPYPKYMNAVMDVDQASAVVLMSVAEARRLGVDESKWVYLHGTADAYEYPLTTAERKDLFRCYGMQAVGRQVASSANVTMDKISHFDIYSCFPAAVQVAVKVCGPCKKCAVLSCDFRARLYLRKWESPSRSMMAINSLSPEVKTLAR